MKQSPRSRFCLLAGVGILSSLTFGVWGLAEPPPQPFARLRRGMAAAEVRKLIGPPKRVARQILYHRWREQWIYDPPAPARLQFDCRRGHEPQLVDMK